MDIQVTKKLTDIVWDRMNAKSSVLYSSEEMKKLEEEVVRIGGFFRESDAIEGISFLHHFCGHEGKIAKTMLHESNSDLVQHLNALENIFENKGVVVSIPQFNSVKDIIDSTSNNQDISADLLKSVFTAPTIQNVSVFIDSVPASCRSVFELADFKSISSEMLCTIINTVRKCESGAQKTRAQYIRAQLLNVLLSEKLSPAVYSKDVVPVFLDINGIFIQIKGLSAHLPYGLVSDEAVMAMKTLAILSEEEVAELFLQRSFERSQKDEYFSMVEKQYDILNKNSEEFSIETYIRTCPIPSGYLKSMLSGVSGDTTYQNVRTLFKLAHSISLEDYNLTDGNTENVYTEQFDQIVRRINTRYYYTIVKIIKAVINAHIKTDPISGFAFVRVEYQTTKTGAKISVINVLYRNESYWCLIDEHKHLDKVEKQLFESLPAFEKGEYYKLLKAHSQLSLATKYLREIEHDHNLLDSKDKTGYILDFILNNVSDRYRDVESSLMLRNIDTFCSTVRESLEVYIKFLFFCLEKPTDFDTEFNPYVKKIDITFSKESLIETEKILKPGHFDNSLFRYSFPVRVVQILESMHNLSRTIPSQIEHSVLDALRLHKERHLINAIGGSLYVSDDSNNPIQEVSKAIVEYAHAHVLNVMVPGTQSGLGAYLANTNVEYQEKNSKLSHHAKMHMFSVTPGGNAYFPGNTFFLSENKDNNFALSPVDSVITPYSADWDIDDKKIRSSKYLLHIAYMESLSARISAGAKHVVVVSNGGIFTLAELDQLLRRRITVLFVSNTGRFASAMSVLLEDIDAVPTQDSSSFYEYVIQILSEKMSPLLCAEFTSKDFGEGKVVQSEKHSFYRDLFLSIVRKIKENNITAVSVTSDMLADTFSKILD